jgi:hypothetical protein
MCAGDLWWPVFESAARARCKEEKKCKFPPHTYSEIVSQSNETMTTVVLGAREGTRGPSGRQLRLLREAASERSRERGKKRKEKHLQTTGQG